MLRSLLAARENGAGRDGSDYPHLSAVATLKKLRMFVRIASFRLRFAVLFLAASLVVPGTSAPSAWAAVEIAPHRAIYGMTLGSVRSNSPVADVRGHMMFEWADACDGWTIEQRFQLNFLYAEGDQMTMTTNYVTWESKDGLNYRFNVRKLVSGELDEEVRGEAVLEPDAAGGWARYLRPEPLTRELAPGTLFPTRHTIELLGRAVAGERFFTRAVFDGADTEGATEISAVVTDPVEAGAVEPDAVDGDAAELLTGRAWPVRLAFFPTDSVDGLPEYEMTLVLLANGVAKSMLIDYGDFTVSAVLEELQALPRLNC